MFMKSNLKETTKPATYICNLPQSFMAFYLITFFILVLVPYVASLNFNLTNIGPQNRTRHMLIEGEGAYISESGIQLTPNENWKSGRVTYTRPLHLWSSKSGELASFSTSFTFVMNSNGSTEYAHGLAFFLAQNNSLITVGAGLGLPVNATTHEMINRFVAVEFDTLGDHVGIDINSLASVRSQKWLSNVTGGSVCHAWVTYDSVSKNLSVSFTGFQNNTVLDQDGLVYTVDLKNELPEWVIFGLSASTGLLFQRTTVISWTFSSSNLQIDENGGMQPNRGHSFNQKNNKVGIKVGLSVAITFLVLLVVVLWIWKKKRREDEQEIGLDTRMNNEFEMGTGPKRFSYQELARSTSNFAKHQKLGQGGFGAVYKGVLEDSRTNVAVKMVSKSSKQGIKEYASEVRIISRLRHKNLVQLRGWCHKKGKLLLVYEYLENGSLDLHLFKGKSLLTWGTRYRIAHELASALLYLHEECEQCVLHRDIKSSNVMLNSNFSPKLGDFGLAKLVDHEKGFTTTSLVPGTRGYMAPEYVNSGKATKESDVYSFGVVTLEIACGRRTIDDKVEENKKVLIDWVWELYETGTLLEAADPHLKSAFNEEEMKCLMIVGLWCVQHDSQHRPTIRQVIQVLKFEASLPKLPSRHLT